MARPRGSKLKKDANPKPAAFELAHVRPVEPLPFGDQEARAQHLREGERHVRLCQALHEILRSAVSIADSSVGAGKFVYFRANDPGRWLAPDAFVKIGVPDEDFACWKSWERGAPDLAFEILSPSDSDEPWPLDETIARYHELGVRELVVFDVDQPIGQRLRVWDRINDDLVERIVEEERTPCITLGLQLAVAPVVIDADTQYPACVRLVRDDGALELTLEEARSAAEQAEQTALLARRQAEHARQAEADANRAEAQSQRSRALARGNAYAAELESAAARRRGGR